MLPLDLYSCYLAERSNQALIAIPEGFVTYQKVDDVSYYIVDIFVLPEFRRSHVATELADKVAEIAIADGANTLIGSVDLTANGVTESLQALLGYGMKFSHASGNGLYFKKLIGG